MSSTLRDMKHMFQLHTVILLSKEYLFAEVAVIQITSLKLSKKNQGFSIVSENIRWEVTLSGCRNTARVVKVQN